VNTMKKSTLIPALAFLAMACLFAPPASAKEDEPMFAVSPLNLELGCRYLGISPMMNPAAGISMEFGLNPGWFLDKQAALGIYFAYAHYFGATYKDAFLSDAKAAYDPIAYPYTNPEDAVGYLLDGELSDLSDHRWGISLRLPLPWTPFLKAYWLSRAVVIKSGSSGSYSTGGVTYVTGYGRSGYSIVAQGIGAELSFPLAPLNWPAEKLTDWLAFTRLSIFGQWVAFSGAIFDDPRPLFSEFFTEGFNSKYANQFEFGLMLSIGF